MSANLDELWADMLLDACASDGPIRDNDVREAMRRGRPRIEAAARATADDLYRALVSEHGHNETHAGVWPSCLPVHIAMNRYRDVTR